jgi:hypothetical protein
MKRFIIPAMLGLALATSASAQVSASIGFSQPGVYGRIDIGRFPMPALIQSQPVYVIPPPVIGPPPPDPIYLWVPREHRLNWARYCHSYNACGLPVFFVRHDWYNSNVRHVNALPPRPIRPVPPPVRPTPRPPMRPTPPPMRPTPPPPVRPIPPPARPTAPPSGRPGHGNAGPGPDRGPGHGPRG